MTVVTPPAIVRPEPRRDQYGRYLIPHPQTGKEQSWTRATTWSSSISDNFGLEKWKIRMTAMGLVNRPDLFASMAAISNPDTEAGKKKLNGLCEEAQEHAGTRFASNLGTALHSFAEQIDLGENPRIPPPWDKDIAAYKQALVDHAIEVSPRYIERIVVVPRLEVAGTMDRLVRWRGKTYVGDLKTGKDLSYSFLEISIQLALYSRAMTIFDVEQNRHFPMMPVDQDHAIVFHLPVGKGTCTPYLIDIDQGWRAAQICGLVREWRKRKDLAHTLEAAAVLPQRSGAV